MNFRIVSVVALILMLSTSQFSLAKTDDPKTLSQAPDGWILVEEDIWVFFPDEPGAQFHQAHESFLKKDYKAAASHIRKAVGFMKLEAAGATDKGEKDLTASVHELEKLAGDVEKGVISSSRDLSQAFANAHRALAAHYHAKVMEAWAKKEETKAGHALKAAVMHLESAAAWAGHKLTEASLAVLKFATSVGEKIVRGSEWTAHEVEKAMDDLGKEMEKLVW